MYRKGVPCLVGIVARKRRSAAQPVPESIPVLRNESPRNTEAAVMRLELVERVRQEIAAGAYDTPERWEAALDRLADRLGVA
jgi:hypothetical protein